MVKGCSYVMSVIAPTWEPTDTRLLKPWYPTRQEQRKHEKRRARARAHTAKPFCAWDGEGITRVDGVHVYTLLAFAVCDPQTGEITHKGHIAAKDEWHPLTSAICFQFILNVAAQHRGVNHVWFAFSYDVNMILGDLPREELELLYERKGKWTYSPSHHVRIQYRPKKTLALSSQVRSRLTGKRRKLYVKMDDTFSFFGTSFVRAVDTYLGGEWPDRELVMAGKAERSTGFGTVDVMHYNNAELRALCLTMNELRERLAYIGIRPSGWYGPGAVASKMLMEHGVKDHASAPPDEVELALRHSYAGGRFEPFRYGSVSGSSFREDIHSAYPDAAAQLTTAQGRWVHHDLHVATTVDIAAIDTLSIYKCEWHCDYASEKYPQPFFYRSEDGHICYPPHVQGWYWGSEVAQAARLPYGQLDVLEQWQFVPDDDSRPFSFLEGYYNLRRELIAQGHPAQLAVKLAINSVYGKLIQQLGWEFDDEGEPVPPSYFCLFWAAQITANTRARLMQLVIDNDGYDDVLTFETDAVFSSRRWEHVDRGDNLGQWEETELADLTYIQSGVYVAHCQTCSGAGCDSCKHSGVTTSHVRGMAKVIWPDRPYEMLRTMVEKRWTPYTYELESFVGLGTGLQQDFTKWRTWQKMPRKLQTLEPSNGLVKRNHDPLVCSCQDDDSSQLEVWHTTRVYPAIYRNGLQRAYDLEWDGPAHEWFDPSELVGEWD